MKYVKQVGIIWGFTMAGEILHAILPLPVPSGGDGGQDQGDNGGLHEHTADQQEDDDQQQQDRAVAGDAQQSVCNGDSDVIEHDAVAEHAGERQNDGDDGDVLHAVAQGLQQALPSQLVVEHGADQQGVCAGKGAGLGGAHDAEADQDDNLWR